jgi:DNA-binding response OmpR family regulator
MPDRDGFDLLRDIRALGPHAGSIPVVAMTALVARVDRSRILERASKHACLSPFTVDELMEAISNVLND